MGIFRKSVEKTTEVGGIILGSTAEGLVLTGKEIKKKIEQKFPSNIVRVHCPSCSGPFKMNAGSSATCPHCGEQCSA